MAGTRFSETSVTYVPICTALCPEGFNLQLDISTTMRVSAAARRPTQPYLRTTTAPAELPSGQADRSLTLRVLWCVGVTFCGHSRYVWLWVQRSVDTETVWL